MTTRASIRQVAQLAGVSPMTVSNVLRSSPGQMGEETRKRVLKAIRELDYIPVRTSAQNRHVRTNAIGIVFLQEMQGAVGYPTFKGMCSRAKALDHDLTIFLRSEPDWVKPGSESQFLDRRCDGFIFVGENRREISEALVRRKIPIVECYSADPPEGVGKVLGNNSDGTRQAVQHLIGLGHEKIAHIAGPVGNKEADERLSGYRNAMFDAFGPRHFEFIARGDTWGDLWGFLDGQDEIGKETRPLAAQVLSSGATAVVCANDLFALGLWRLAAERGLKVPEDLSITGLDNIIEGAHKGLTSISVPFEEIGRAAIDAVLSMLDGGDAGNSINVLPVSLVKRSSTGPR